MDKILLLASQHGNEYSGEKLHTYIQAKHPDLLQHITYLVANPKARKSHVRFIETDMNRSYTGASRTYEERRAGKVSQIIDTENFDLILDMHTTTVHQSPCLIVGAIALDNERFIRASSIDKIVIMNNPIVGSSINGMYSHAISVEINENMADEGLLESLCEDIQRYLGGKNANVVKYIYEVTELIYKKELTSPQVSELRNFEISPYGYYPVLAGENSYSKFTEFCGFKAYKRYEFKV